MSRKYQARGMLFVWSFFYLPGIVIGLSGIVTNTVPAFVL